MAQDVSFESVDGFTVAAVKAGIKASGNLDLGIVVADAPVAAAGVFTKNKVVSPSVGVTRGHLQATGGHARAIVVNAGNANTCTGEEGRRNAIRTAEVLAQAIGARADEVLVCSTGVIGHQLPMEKMESGIGAAAGVLGSCEAGAFARAIMTTDLAPKQAGMELPALEGARIAGVCKGSGMIAPNMATMLGFVLTDACVAPEVLQAALSDVVETTFNAVTVDGDTSTNDSVLVMASGKRGPQIDTQEHPLYGVFRDGLHAVCLSLAEQIAIDGEGATKLVRVSVRGAASLEDARNAARTVAESPLVKTAMFGNDPNWGRILAALGRSGAQMDELKTDVSLCGVQMFEQGTPQPFDAPSLSKAMKAKDIAIEVEMGLGTAEMTMLTCDFSYDYVKINAEYHT